MTDVYSDEPGKFLRCDSEIEHWLQGKVAAAIDALKADPGHVLSTAQVR